MIPAPQEPVASIRDGRMTDATHPCDGRAGAGGVRPLPPGVDPGADVLAVQAAPVRAARGSRRQRSCSRVKLICQDKHRDGGGTRKQCHCRRTDDVCITNVPCNVCLHRLPYPNSQQGSSYCAVITYMLRHSPADAPAPTSRPPPASSCCRPSCSASLANTADRVGARPPCGEAEYGDRR